MPRGLLRAETVTRMPIFMHAASVAMLQLLVDEAGAALASDACTFSFLHVPFSKRVMSVEERRSLFASDAGGDNEHTRPAVEFYTCTPRNVAWRGGDISALLRK